MPKRKGETDEAWLARIRASRSILNQTRIGDNSANELAAFMSLFHPDYPEEKARELIIDANQQHRNRR